MNVNASRKIIVGKGIREIRRARGLSQENIAERVGVKQKVVSDWERGRVEPREENQQLIADALGCEWTDFFLVGLREPEVLE